MEAGNVVFVPGLALAIGFPGDVIEALAIGLAIVATAGFLVVGTLFWRGVDRRLSLGDREAATRALSFADRVEKPLLATTGGALVATLTALAMNGVDQRGHRSGAADAVGGAWSTSITTTARCSISTIAPISCAWSPVAAASRRTWRATSPRGGGRKRRGRAARTERVATARHVRVTGRVQGVFFRALDEGAGGRARGRWLGAQLRRRVGRGRLSGEAQAVAQLIARMRRGPPGARWRGWRRARWRPSRSRDSPSARLAASPPWTGGD